MDISKEEENSLNYYATSNGCEDINGVLRGIKSASPSMQGKIQESIKNIDSAISRTKIDRDIISYRGVSGSLLRRKIPQGEEAIGYTVNDKAFTSTSLSSETALDFNAYSTVGMFSIKVPKGTNAAYIGHRGEYELLLGRDSTFKITGYKKVRGLGGKELHVYDAELV